ncbi:MAG: DUF1573 domain-containing protein [Chitinophagaceae bacterium]|nr:DUF1573 domain-containing protein [Chitinophagaceae bacterium]
MFLKCIIKVKVPLTITNVTASCGCTTPEWGKDKSVCPGEKTTIKVGS